MNAARIVFTVVWSLGCLGTSAAFVQIGYTEPIKSSLIPASVRVENLPEVRSSKGIWKKDGNGQYNFFCSSDGAYEGHVKYVEAGYWNTYEGDKDRGTFIDLPSAKRYVERKVANCD